MSKLILCLGQDTFTLDVKQIEKNEEGQWRYWNYYLDTKYPNSQEIIRILRYLGYGTGFEPVWDNVRSGKLIISKNEQHTRGFFGSEKIVTKYFLRKPVLDEELHLKAMYLEE